MDPEQGQRTVIHWKNRLDVLATILVILAAGAFFARLILPLFALRNAQGGSTLNQAPPSGPIPTEPIALKDAPLKGDPSARVVMFEYSDFQCPYCMRFAHETMPEIERRYVSSGKVLLAFIETPSPRHPLAEKAAEVAECAARQQHFWQMHDRLFQDPRSLDEATMRRYANDIGLNLAAFDRCADGQSKSKVQADVEGAKAIMISGTPTFLIGTVGNDRRIRVRQRLDGAQPLSRFVSVLDAVLSASH